MIRLFCSFQFCTAQRGTPHQRRSVEGRAPLRRGEVMQLAVELRGEASWPAALAFTHVLEGSARLLDVSTVRIERAGGASGLGSTPIGVTYSAVIAGYARKAP